MSTTLVLIRHAKAASPEGVADHDRPLAEHGRRDATAAGRWLRAADVSPRLAIVSSARRTRETYGLLVAELAAPPPQLRVTDDAYYGGAGDLLELVRAVPEQVTSVMVVAHNPGIAMLADLLDDGVARASVAGDVPRSGYPTASVSVFALDRPWPALDPGTARLTAFTVARADP